MQTIFFVLLFLVVLRERLLFSALGARLGGCCFHVLNIPPCWELVRFPVVSLGAFAPSLLLLGQSFNHLVLDDSPDTSVLEHS